MNETKLIALNGSSFAGEGGRSRTSENRIYFSVLKSHITEVMFLAYLDVLLVACSLQKPSKGKRGVFFLLKLCTRVVFLKHA